MATLLSKVSTSAARDRVQRNTVIQVKEVNASDPDPAKHYIVGIDILAQKKMRVFMGKALSEFASENRITISDLSSHSTRKVEVDGYVTVNRLSSREGSDYECLFLQTIKASPSDDSRHFMVGSIRPFPVQGVADAQPFAMVDYVLSDKSERVSNGNILVNTIANHLLNHQYGALGAPMALLRDGPNTQPMRVVAKMINDGGVYRLPNEEEVLDQLSKNNLVAGLREGLNASGGSASVEILAGNRFVMSGKSATSSAYEAQSQKLFRGTFKMFNSADDGATMVNKITNGFRTGILCFNKGDDRFFLNSVTATLSDSLTLTGNKDSKAIFIQTQSPASTPQNAQKPAQSSNAAQREIATNDLDKAVNDVFSSGGDNDDLDSLLDDAFSQSSIADMDSAIEQASAEYHASGDNPGMNN